MQITIVSPAKVRTMLFQAITLCKVSFLGINFICFLFKNLFVNCIAIYEIVKRKKTLMVSYQLQIYYIPKVVLQIKSPNMKVWLMSSEIQPFSNLEFYFCFCHVLVCSNLVKPFRADAVVDWQTNKVIEMVYFTCYQINIQG